MKKGFTLLELLAVITILGIIAIIVVPSVKKVIDKAEKETFKSSALGIVNAAKILYGNDSLDGSNEEVKFTYTDGEETSSVVGRELDYDGQNPDSGEVAINDIGEVAIALYNGKYCAEKGYKESKITLSEKAKEECKIFECGMQLVDNRDENTYNTVQIGEQCWMAENLRYTGNGCLSNTWNNIAPHDACNTHTTNWGEEILYQWEAVMNGSTTEGAQGLCPDGWYIPTDAEWTELTNFVGTTPGTKLKSTAYNSNGTDTVGFNAKLAGYRITLGSLNDVGTFGFWWTSSISGSDVWYHGLYSGDSAVSRFAGSQATGSSVRCIAG